MPTIQPRLFREKSFLRTIILKWFYLGGSFLIILLCVSCAAVVLPPGKIRIVVKEAHSGAPVANACVTLIGDTTIQLPLTNKLGYTEFNCNKKVRDKIGNCMISYACVLDQSGESVVENDTIKLNKYIQLYDLYLVRKDSQEVKTDTTNLVADMHYHVSLRTHNLFGYDLYEDKNSIHIPDNLNWYKKYKKLKVLYNGKWKNRYLGQINFDRRPTNLDEKREGRMTTLLEHQWVKSKGGTNFLAHYTQATYPHLKEGRVFLAFNAFTPFEHNVSSTKQKRFILRRFVTGAPVHWLERIGWQDEERKISHWENFNYEYDMITSQKRDINQFGLRFYDTTTVLNDYIPTIVNVVEGSHTLQDKLFPHSVNYDIGNRTLKENDLLFEEIIDKAGRKYLNDDTIINTLLRYEKEIFGKKITPELPTGEEAIKSHWASLATETKATQSDSRKRTIKKLFDRLDRTYKAELIDSLLSEELTNNIDSLKRLDPPICMMTIAHLTYNGMMGHAPNVDGGKFPNNIVAKKNYNIRVSDDPSYKKQWEGVFFTIPGVNKFGKEVIDSLISTTNGHRIFIDLKHGDLFTRDYFFNSVMTRAGQDTIPPICSHCAVTGLPKHYYSPFVDDYSLIRTRFTKTFYPFAINLFDEEIAEICKNKGIIGVPLEQRMLGGYVNNRQIRDYYITKGGTLSNNPDKKQYNRRWECMRRWLKHYLFSKDPDFLVALDYTHDTMGVDFRTKGVFNKDSITIARIESGADSISVNMNGVDYFVKRRLPILDILKKDYISAEPFLQNVFHIMDQSGLEPSEAWKHICIGSDLDGMIDPIDICPTASQYPQFKKRLKLFIPIFLKMRADMASTTNKPFDYDHYFPDPNDIDIFLNQLFYKSLHDFTKNNFLKDKQSSS